MRCTGAAVEVFTDEECASDDRWLMVAGLVVAGPVVPDGPAVSVIEAGI